MQSTLELICPECHKQFDSALSLLKHFAFQQKINLLRLALSNIEEGRSPTRKRLPDLYPINFKKRFNPNSSDLRKESDVEGDSGIEDVNPMKFCEVTMDYSDDTKLVLSDKKTRKHECSHCTKRFETKRDLKRHILTHTGEKPFKCKSCSMAFTRKFILKKHESKFHHQNSDSVKKRAEPKE